MYQKQIYLSILVLLLASGIGFGALEGLVGHWTLDDGSGTIVTDSSEHANGGVLQGLAADCGDHRVVWADLSFFDQAAGEDRP